MKVSLATLDKLPITVIQDFQKTGSSQSIPPQIQEYIIQLTAAAEIRRVEHNISRAAEKLQEKHPELAFETARQRIYDAINRFHINNTVSIAAWNNYYADRMEDAARTALMAFKNMTEHRRCMEKARQFRIDASEVAIDPNDLKIPKQLISPDVTPERLNIPEKNLKVLWANTESYITKLPIDKKAKEQSKREAAENLGRKLVMSKYHLKAIQEFTQKYNSVIQTKALLADPQNLIGELGRGSGKTREILAPRLIRVATAMPRSIIALAGPTYVFVVDSISEGILTYLNLHYKRGKHFEYGKEPPKYFDRPFTEINDWKHTISFPNGAVTKFAGVDRPNTSLVGQNIAHILIDELLRINETNFRERLMPAKRGDRSIHGKSHLFGGITGFSSTPNLENDHDWWLAYQENMDEDLINEIMYVALRVSQALAQAEIWSEEKDLALKDSNWDFIKKIDPKIDQKLRFAARWENKLTQKRKGATYYMKGTSFTNLAVLGLEYFKEQFDGSKGNLEKVKLSLFGIRPNKVTNPFFSKFSQKNIFEDSYNYDLIDIYDLEGERKKSSRDLKYCNKNAPLLMGLDPGDFMSCVFGQMKTAGRNKELRVFKNMWVISPDEHFELAQMINKFFEYHESKVIYMHYDRAGNQHKDKYKNNPKGNTDATILKGYLEGLGWTIHLLSLDQRTIYYWEHFFLQSRILGEKESNTPRIKICQNECEELISSIQMTPKKKSDNVFIIMDKSAEKKLSKEDQVFWSPQIATSWMYLMWGLFEKYLPDVTPETADIEGL